MYEGFPGLLGCLIGNTDLQINSIWYCVASYISSLYGVKQDQMTTGPRPWHVQYTVYNTAGAYPYASDYGATPALLTSGLSVTSLNMPEGTYTDSPAIPSTGYRFFEGDGANAASIGNVTLGYAVAYSSSFVNMGCGMRDLSKNSMSPCAYKGIPALLMNYGMHVGLQNGDVGQATDGGESELLGVIPLLRDKKTSIVMNYVEPDDITTGKMKRLFGLNYSKPTNPCSAGKAVGGQIGVFPTELWDELAANMSSTENTGVHVMRNVPVTANPAIGVEAYTLDTLIVIDNMNKTAFEQTVLGGSLETIAYLSKLGYPNQKSLSLEITPATAVAMSLLQQWKIEQNADVLAAALGAA